MAKTVFDVLRDKINEDKASLQVFLSGGGAKDFAEYRELTGKIRGYDSCINHVEDLAKNYLEEDDD
jgi:small nuclear ribonucleoprotein (snRNP)-like protein